VTREKLHHPDPNTNGPERAKLQQGLIDLAEASSDHPQLKQAKQRYRKDVQALGAQHNSVVVSSGNQEQVADKLAQDANGIRPRIDPSKNVNVLVNSEVTTVGATRWWSKDGQLSEHLAGYSNRSSEVDLYASGSVPSRNRPDGPPDKGTSFAAPRVTAAMAAKHRAHPHLNSRQIEDLVKQSLTHQTQGEPVLNYEKTAAYLQGQTF